MKRRLNLISSPKDPSAPRLVADPKSFLPGLPCGSNILVIRLRSIGDIVLLTPSLRLLKAWRPDLHLSVMVESRFRDLLKGNPCVDEVLCPGAAPGLKRTVESMLTLRKIRKKALSLCVNLHGGPRSAVWVRCCGAKWKAGFGHFRSPGIYDFSIPDAREILGQRTIHTAEHQAAAFFWLGLPRQPIPPSELFVSDEGRSEWRGLSQALGLPSGREYAIIQPTALYRTKEWPPERFAQLGEYLERSAGLIPIFSRGPGESARLDEVERSSARPICRLEHASLAALIAAVAGARLFVGNDSGPAHIAAALGRPLIVIFGSSSSPIWGPWAGALRLPGGSRIPAGRPFRVVQNRYECNPCRGDHCYQFSQPECILSISFDQVRSAIDSVLNEASPVARTEG